MSPRHGEILCMSAIHAAVPPAHPKEGSKTAPGAPTARGYHSRRRRTSSLPEHVRVPRRPFFPPHRSWGANSPHRPPCSSAVGIRRETPTSQPGRSCNSKPTPGETQKAFFLASGRWCSRSRVAAEVKRSYGSPTQAAHGSGSGPKSSAGSERGPVPACRRWASPATPRLLEQKKGLVPSPSCSHRHERCQQKSPHFQPAGVLRIQGFLG